MKKSNETPVVVVSLFSGMDFFLQGMVDAGMKPAYANEFNKYAARIHAHHFKGPDGESLIRMVKLSVEEAEELLTKLEDPGKEKVRKNYLRNHVIELKDGSYERPERIQDVNGKEIRELCHKLYGKNIRIVLIGGPPCQDYTILNTAESQNREINIFEYQRFLEQLRPDVALMEEVPEIVSKKHIDKYLKFLKLCAGADYRVGYKVMNAVLYEGKQSRVRCFTMMVHNDLDRDPVFPEAMPNSAMRVEDVLDIDHFFSGHFTDTIKTKRDFMCTVTSGSPLWFKENGVKRKPTYEELMMFQGIKPEHKYELPAGIPQDQILKAIGNGVPVNVAYHLGKTIMEKIFDQQVDSKY